MSRPLSASRRLTPGGTLRRQCDTGGLVYVDCAELRMPRDTTKALHRLAAHWSFPAFMLSRLSRLEVLSQRSDGVSR
jgi:hypothetical protein